MGDFNFWTRISTQYESTRQTNTQRQTTKTMTKNKQILLKHTHTHTHTHTRQYKYHIHKTKKEIKVYNMIFKLLLCLSDHNKKGANMNNGI